MSFADHGRHVSVLAAFKHCDSLRDLAEMGAKVSFVIDDDGRDGATNTNDGDAEDDPPPPPPPPQSPVTPAPSMMNSATPVSMVERKRKNTIMQLTSQGSAVALVNVRRGSRGLQSPSQKGNDRSKALKKARSQKSGFGGLNTIVDDEEDYGFDVSNDLSLGGIDTRPLNIIRNRARRPTFLPSPVIQGGKSPEGVGRRQSRQQVAPALGDLRDGRIAPPQSRRPSTAAEASSVSSSPGKSRVKKRPSTSLIKKSRRYKGGNHEIDYVGNSSVTRHPRCNIVHKRTKELSNTWESQLSARGIHHRNMKHFREKTQTHSHSLRQARKMQSNSQAEAVVLFNRAYAYERCGKQDRALVDYNRCLSIWPQCALAHFNRASIYYAQGYLTKAVEDLSAAIRLDSRQRDFFENRALMYRKKGMFIESMADVECARRLARGLAPFASRAATEAKMDDENSEYADDKEKDFSHHDDEDPVLQLLEKRISDRTELDIRQMAEVLGELHYLQFLTDDALLKFCKVVHHQRVLRNSYIFRQGDRGAMFYILYQGAVNITINRVDPDKTTTEEVTVKRLHKGDAFGEAAIHNPDGLRTAHAFVEQTSRLLWIGVEDYKTILGHHHTQLRMMKLAALKQCSVFRTWPEKKIRELADKVAIKLFEPQSVVLRKGDPVSEFCVIRRGVCSVMKAVTDAQLANKQGGEAKNVVPHIRGAKRGGKKKKRDRSKRWMDSIPDSDKVPLAQAEDKPGIWVVHTDWRDRTDADRREDIGKQLSVTSVYEKATTLSRLDEKEFTVGVIASGQFFGELAVLDPDKSSPVTVISNTNLEVFAIKKDDLLELGARFNTNMLNCLNQSMTMYNPPGEKVAHYLRSKLMWEAEKEKLLRDVMPERWNMDRVKTRKVASDGLTEYNRKMSVQTRNARATALFKRTRGVTLLSGDV